MNRDRIAWRDFVTKDLEVIAWPLMLTDHADFHYKFGTQDEDFAARWRQWAAGGRIDFDPGASEDAKQAVREFVGEHK